MVHAPLNRMAQRQRLPLARHHNHDLPAIQHRRHTHRQRHMRHLADIALEEPRVRQNRVVCEGLDPRARRERGAGLVERDVAVRADAEDLHVHAAGVRDGRLVRRARRRDVLGEAVGAVHVRRVDVDAGRELLLDDVAVALRVVGGQADVLVEGEAAGLRE